MIFFKASEESLVKFNDIQAIIKHLTALIMR